MLRGRFGTARWAGALSMTAEGPRKEAAAARQTEQDSMLVLVGVGAQEAASIASIVEKSGDGPFASARVVRLGPAQLGLAMQDALALGAVAVPGDAARAAAAGEAGEAEEAEETEEEEAKRLVKDEAARSRGDGHKGHKPKPAHYRGDGHKWHEPKPED